MPCLHATHGPQLWPLLSLWGISRPFGDHPHISTHTCGLAGWGRCKSWRSSAGRPKKRKSRRSRRYVALGSGLLVYVLVKRQPRTSTAKDTHAGSVSVRTYMNLETPAGTGCIQRVRVDLREAHTTTTTATRQLVVHSMRCAASLTNWTRTRRSRSSCSPLSYVSHKGSTAQHDPRLPEWGDLFECLWNLRRRFTFSVSCVLLPKSPSKKRMIRLASPPCFPSHDARPTLRYSLFSHAGFCVCTCHPFRLRSTVPVGGLIVEDRRTHACYDLGAACEGRLERP